MANLHIIPWASLPLFNFGPFGFGISFGFDKDFQVPGFPVVQRTRPVNGSFSSPIAAFASVPGNYPEIGAEWNLPNTSWNQLSESEQLRRLYNITRGTIESSPENYRVPYLDLWMRDHDIRTYDHWLKNYPAVDIRIEENPHVDPRLIRTPWGDKPNPPLVNVGFLPRKKPKPKRSFFSKIAPYLGIAANFIPVVGQVISGAISIGAAADQKSWIEAWEVPDTAFDRQYSPKRFTVPLPLDRAQLILSQPWYGPVMVYEWTDSVQKLDLERMARNFDAWMGVEREDSNLLPENFVNREVAELRSSLLRRELLGQAPQPEANGEGGGNLLPLLLAGGAAYLALNAIE